MGSVTLHTGAVGDKGSATGGITGSGAVWDDVSDSTFLETTKNAASGLTRVGFADLDLLSLPSGATVTAVTVNMRAASEVGSDSPASLNVAIFQGPTTGTFPPFDATWALGVVEPSGNIYGWEVETAGVATDVSHTFNSEDFTTWGTDLTTLAAKLVAGAKVYAYTPGLLSGSGTMKEIVYELSVTVTWDDGTIDLPCDTWVDLDLSTAVFVDSGSGILGQYVDGVITGLDGQDPHYSFPLSLDPLKGDLVEVTFDPTSPWDGTGDPMISDRFILLRDYLPGDEVTPGDDVQIGDGFDNLADVCTLKIGPGVGNWDDGDFGVTQGYTGLRFQTSFSGAVSAIRIRKLCTVGAPPLRQYPRNDGLGASTTRRVWPVPNTIQASNRRGPSAIL